MVEKGLHLVKNEEKLNQIFDEIWNKYFPDGFSDLTEDEIQTDIRNIFMDLLTYASLSPENMKNIQSRLVEKLPNN
jgi:hypothetical protein